MSRPSGWQEYFNETIPPIVQQSLGTKVDDSGFPSCTCAAKRGSFLEDITNWSGCLFAFHGLILEFVGVLNHMP